MVLAKLFYNIFRPRPPAAPDVRPVEFGLALKVDRIPAHFDVPGRSRLSPDDLRILDPSRGVVEVSWLVPPAVTDSRTLGVDFPAAPPFVTHPLGLDLGMPLPLVSGRVFVRFVPRPMKDAADATRREASRPRPPDNIFDQLFFLLFPRDNWDVRVHGLNALLAAYPEHKKPYEFQLEGVKFLAERKHALLADEMGLGKTIQAILAMRSLIHSGRIARVLVVCPRSLLANWAKEISEWAPELSITVAHGLDREQALRRTHHVYITNYETVTNSMAQFRNDTPCTMLPHIKPFDLLIADEGQNYKNPSTQKARAIHAIVAERRWVLTGTPLENSFDDYRAIWRVIDPAARHDRLIDSGGTRYTDDEMLRATKHDVLRREKRAVLKQLPDMISKVEYVDLDGRQLAAYQRLETRARDQAKERVGTESSEGQLRMHILALLQELKKTCICDAASGESAKMEWIGDRLNEMRDQHDDPRQCEKALVFTQYPNLVWDEWALPKRVSGHAPLRYDGSVRQDQRDHFVARFQNDEQHRVGFVGLKAGGTGLTLTRANHVVFIDSWWNPAVMDQAAARVHRIGQERTCYATTLVARDTIEERIMKILESKRSLFEEVMADIKAGRKTAEDVNDLKNALTLDDMLEALGLDRRSPVRA